MNWHELSQATPDQILAWAADRPWCRAMAECRQDAVWHSEGDVWTHTQMVCAQLARLEPWPTLTPKERTILSFTALFHDAGKPLTSQIDPDTGRITSPKHAPKGEKLARAALRELGCDLQTREEIARLVRFHGRPGFLLEREDPNKEVASLSWWVNNRLLYLFALADVRGRATTEMGRPEEHVHYWKLVAEETGCYDQPFPFGNDQARFLFYREPSRDLHYVPHESYRSTVTMMSGLPGSGKDTWLKRNRPELPVISLDDLRGEIGVDVTDDQGEVAQLARERCQQHLRTGESFAFNATNLLRQTRKRWIDLFANYGARIEIVYVEPPLSVILAQNKRRTPAVPETVINKLAEKCEPPTWAEAHGLTLVAM